MSTTATTPFCVTCKKPAGVFKCHGCLQIFCTDHVAEHRQNLNKSLDELISNHQHTRHSIVECENKSSRRPLTKIDQWEQQSIETIRKVANDARTQLLNLLNKITTNMMEKLESLSKELNKAREDNTFVETDLQAWMTKLNKLNNDVNVPQTILIREDTYDNESCIYPISAIAVPNAFFGQSIGNIEIKENGHIIEQGLLPPAGAVRAMGHYSSGCHQFRFKIENLATHLDRKWILFGIISIVAPVETQSYKAPTVYGWAGKNKVYCNGIKSIGFEGYISDMEKNDTLMLLINCNQRTIRLTNERTNSKHQLKIDVNSCPLPWQPFVCLYYAGDQVRIRVP